MVFRVFFFFILVSAALITSTNLSAPIIIIALCALYCKLHSTFHYLFASSFWLISYYYYEYLVYSTIYFLNVILNARVVINLILLIFFLRRTDISTYFSYRGLFRITTATGIKTRKRIYQCQIITQIVNKHDNWQ